MRLYISLCRSIFFSGDCPNVPRALPGRNTRTGAISSTFSQRAVATSFERTTGWRLRFFVFVSLSFARNFLGGQGQRTYWDGRRYQKHESATRIGQSPLAKDAIGDQPFFNPHYLTACLF